MDEHVADTGPGGGDAGISSPEPRLELRADKEAKDQEFELFYGEQVSRLIAFLVVGHGADLASAADIAQDAMTAAYRNWDSIDTPRAWVRTTASRKWWLRSRRDQAEIATEDPGELGLVSPALADEIEARHVFLSLMRTLPLGQREVMAWIYDGYQPTEIAALLGKPAATVRSLLRDARETLRNGNPEEIV